MTLAAIDLQQLWKSYDGQPALQGLSLDAFPGESLGLIGPNGAGKTTTLKILVGLLGPDYGMVRVRGHDVLVDPVGYKAELGYMPEAPTLPEYLTPTEFLGYVGRIRNLPKDRLAARTSELLKVLDLTPKANETIASLSKGMKAKVAFAAAIIHEPSILVLDEPLIGIDPAGQHLLKERLLAMAQAGSTVLVSTHQLDTAERLCRRVAIVHHGRNVATGDLAALRTPAHASEFDFLLTADVRPREYLAADLLFQLVSLLGAGGLSAGVAAIGMAVTAGRPASAALSLFGLLIVYAFFVLMTSQVLVILRVRFPKAPVRLVTVALLILSMLPAAALADPAFPIRFADLPLPSTAYAALGLAVLRGTPLPFLDIVLAPVYAGRIAIAVLAMSNA